MIFIENMASIDWFLLSRFFFSQSRDMIASWLNLQEENGWIAREQILGEEAESRVCFTFHHTHTHTHTNHTH
jgi:hypothetical protein